MASSFRHCETQYKNKPGLKEHIKRVHSKIVDCNNYKEKFIANFELEDHLVNLHNKSKSYECDDCDMKLVLEWCFKKRIEGHSTKRANKTCHF